MHEGNYTEQIVEAILQALKKNALSSPKKVHVKVGEMLHLEPESVLMHYRSLTANSMLAKTELCLEEVPVVVHCNQCGLEGGVEDHHLLMCPICESRDLELLSGHDVTVESIECEK